MIILNFICGFSVGSCSPYLVLLKSDVFYSLVYILPSTYWLSAAVVFFNDSNLFYCCIKDIFFSSNHSRIPRNPKFIDQLPLVEFFFCLSVFQNDWYIDWYFFSLFPPKFPNDPVDYFLNCFFSLPLILLQNYISI